MSTPANTAERCWCDRSDYRPHPQTPEHGHACQHPRTHVVEDGPGFAGGFLVHVCDDCGQDVDVVR